MEVLDTLENMALKFQDQIHEPDEDTCARWNRLFHLNDPYRVIIDFRNNFDAPTISDSRWEEVRSDMEAQGHDRESISIRRHPHKPLMKSYGNDKHKQNSLVYLLRLLPALPEISTPEAVQKMAGLQILPFTEQDEDGVLFVRMLGLSKMIIEGKLAEKSPDTLPTFIRLTLPARKDLSRTSKYPVLGIDSTLPHNRPSTMSGYHKANIQADEYPVWYFFYGTLANAEILRDKLGLGDDVVMYYFPTAVRNARLSEWGAKYKALLDGASVVTGAAYMVKDRNEEDLLRAYETDRYEVVRCEIEFEDGEVRKGLTFRFLG